MTKNLVIAGKEYAKSDFKTQFTFRQMSRAATLVQTIFEGEDSRAVIGSLWYAVDKSLSPVQRAAAVADAIDRLLKAKGFFESPELRQLFFVFFLPVGVAWNAEYEATLAARADEIADVPFWPLVEAVKDFFSFKTTPEESLTTSSEAAPA